MFYFQKFSKFALVVIYAEKLNFDSPDASRSCFFGGVGGSRRWLRNSPSCSSAMSVLTFRVREPGFISGRHMSPDSSRLRATSAKQMSYKQEQASGTCSFISDWSPVYAFIENTFHYLNPFFLHFIHQTSTKWTNSATWDAKLLESNLFRTCYRMWLQWQDGSTTECYKWPTIPAISFCRHNGLLLQKHETYCFMSGLLL